MDTVPWSSEKVPLLSCRWFCQLCKPQEGGAEKYHFCPSLGDIMSVFRERKVEGYSANPSMESYWKVVHRSMFVS